MHWGKGHGAFLRTPLSGWISAFPSGRGGVPVWAASGNIPAASKPRGGNSQDKRHRRCHHHLPRKPHVRQLWTASSTPVPDPWKKGAPSPGTCLSKVPPLRPIPPHFCPSAVLPPRLHTHQHWASSPIFGPPVARWVCPLILVSPIQSLEPIMDLLCLMSLARSTISFSLPPLLIVVWTDQPLTPLEWGSGEFQR